MAYMKVSAPIGTSQQLVLSTNFRALLLQYGNQSELEHHYASIAIIARVPPYGTAQRPAPVEVTTEAPTASVSVDEDMH
jgi:hypothetical protein